MKKILVLSIFIFALNLFATTPPIGSWYTDWDEMNQKLADLAEQYPDILRVDTLLTTETDQLPIFGVKVSNNVDVKEDEPRLLFVGTCHAEEVMGTEITLSHIEEICEHRNQFPYSYWLATLELWFVPTMNPEGMRCVFGFEEDNDYYGSQLGEWYEDSSFRKNRRDVNNNQIFDYDPELVGYDIDGVDQNRNYPFNWVHGDSLYHVGSSAEVYDYYRGPYPLSEAGNRAIDQLNAENNFIYSIHWHSSRSGNFAEKVYYSFDWYKNIETGQSFRPSPDLDLSEHIATNVATRIDNQAGDGTYQAFASSGRKGSEHDYLYKEYGTIQLLIECATLDLQPDSLIMEDTIERCKTGESWMINRALPYHQDIDNRSILTGHVTDANTGIPIEAEIIIEEKNARFFTPRLSDEFGRYWRPLLGGSYTLRVQKEGYETQILENVIINESGWTTRDIALIPLQPLTFSGVITSNGEQVAAKIEIEGINNNVFETENGAFSIPFYSGEYQLKITSENCYPLIQPITFNSTTIAEIELSEQTIVFEEDWENGIGNWQVNGDWQVVENVASGGYSVDDSWNEFYDPNCDWDIISEQIVLTESNILSFDQRLYTEWDFDFATVEVSTDSQNWDVVYQNSGCFDFWHEVYVSLSDYDNQTIYLRFHLTADSPNDNLVDPGWIFDNIKIFSGSSSVVPNDDDTQVAPMKISLNQNFPNPFNPTTKIPFYISSEFKNASLSIYNIKGQEVESFNISEEDQRNGFKIWNANKNATGIYFYKLQVDNKVSEVRKAILLK